jgi:hypothetical protein
MSKKILTPNQLYGGMNNRFDRRVKLLHSLGFVRRALDKNWVVYEKPSFRSRQIPATFVMHASKETWVDRLSQILDRG